MASFRQRLQHKHNLSLPHIQTSDIPPPPPPPPAPWPGGRGSLGAGAATASDLAWSAGPGPAFPSAAASPHPASAHPVSSFSSASASSGFRSAPPSARPPLSPRGFSASAAVLTGQSRFVEGSMNDRVSTAPPPGFLGLDDYDDDDDDDDDDRGREVDGQWERARARVGGGVGRCGRPALPREGDDGRVWHHGSVAGGWIRSSAPAASASAVQQETTTQQRGGGGGGGGGGGVVKKTSFLAPLWDGVREKLHLSKSKSSGSIGRVVSSMVGGGGSEQRKVDREKDKERLMGREEKASGSGAGMAGYPSREEVLESYKNLMASGFFEAHAIRGGRHPLRHPLRTGGAAAASNGTRSFAEHMAAPQNAASAPGKSFADHMAAVRQQRPTPTPTVPLSSPIRGSMAPPPPPRGSSWGKPASMSSPNRGTKRGASIDLAGDAEIVTRKLVKKLRHSASRLSIDLTGARKKSSQYEFGTLGRPRPSTSPNPSGPLSPTSSIFSAFTSPPSIEEFGGGDDDDDNDDDNTSIRPGGRLIKLNYGGRRRILGLARRRPFSERPLSASAVEADPDAMMIDEPEEQQQQDGAHREREPEPEPEQMSSALGQRPPKPRGNFTPPPAAFLTDVRRSVRVVSTSESDIMSLEEEDGKTEAEAEAEWGPHDKQPHGHGHGHGHGHKHEDKDERPLSVVPDPNQGIPLVPRIPREFCDAMAALAPPAPAAVVVVGPAANSGGEAAKKMKKMEREEEAERGGDEAKAANRDSGLGGDVDVDVENIPVWGS
ncbi:hypothetical protein MYCTH_2121672 [Thermothelomyces thermophilus ATCC 42464]|uniref:Uncharacterized protein n=1 Tax=Thermothelomyces thermophilus (strain ATCC 42464 / BCRC 31852 / DSM 1799) TaxID=573729 RepID=G2QN32_THET4|nr:uncharacterized protein MYCTH_2121672 [Thermothelomyces thermophilus ATCC 42464]AEO61905.1 hypothetical protein MYCTH_2121672 [Thermothelomyces thermophilus ATCC 42464]